MTTKLLIVKFKLVTSLHTYFNNLTMDKYPLFQQVRPLNDQSECVQVYVSFYLASILEVNDISQRILSNGNLEFWWTDQVSLSRVPLKSTMFSGVSGISSSQTIVV